MVLVWVGYCFSGCGFDYFCICNLCWVFGVALFVGLVWCFGVFRFVVFEYSTFGLFCLNCLYCA